MTELHSQECAPLYNLEVQIRDRLKNDAAPITIEEASRYSYLLKQMNKNTNILSRLIEQAIKLQNLKDS